MVYSVYVSETLFANDDIDLLRDPHPVMQSKTHTTLAQNTDTATQGSWSKCQKVDIRETVTTEQLSLITHRLSKYIWRCIKLVLTTLVLSVFSICAYATTIPPLHSGHKAVVNDKWFFYAHVATCLLSLLEAVEI